MGWPLTKDAGLPVKYSNLVNAVPTCSVCSKQCPGLQPKGSGATYWSVQLLRDGKIASTGSLPLHEDSEYARFVWTLGLTEAFLYRHENQAATIRGLEELSTTSGCLCQMHRHQGSHPKGHNVQAWAQEQNTENKFHLF